MPLLEEGGVEEVKPVEVTTPAWAKPISEMPVEEKDCLLTLRQQIADIRLEIVALSNEYHAKIAVLEAEAQALEAQEIEAMKKQSV